jgi:4-amino-4-deoxy-L-arabinose transferase-like glycosyltransferase
MRSRSAQRIIIFLMRNVGAALAAIFLAALVHAAFFIVYQQPDWNVAWTDQGGYRMLANGLITTGRFTRYPEATEFVPEAIRTPGYPLFLAAVYLAAGPSHIAVAVAQAVVFASLCLVAYFAARHVASPGVSVAAAALVAAYPMFPYFGALTLTELWTTFVLTSGMALCLHAVKTGRAVWFAASGFLVGFTSLTRPGFFLLPAFLAIAALVHLWQSPQRRPVVIGWTAFLLAFAAVMGPWFAYNYRHFGQLTLSAAGNLGRPIWEASWQGHWAGRTQAQLTRIADEADSDAELERAIQHFAAEQRLPPGPMLDYTRQWRTIRLIWTTPTDPEERVRARIAGDEEYLRVGVENIKRDPLGYLRRRFTRALFVLWSADVPIRHSDINATPTWVIRGFWLLQSIVLAIALFGIYRLARVQGLLHALLLALPLVYVTAVHLPILCEARQSLPVKPLVFVLAAIGGAGLLSPIISRRTAGS